MTLYLLLMVMVGIGACEPTFKYKPKSPEKIKECQMRDGQLFNIACPTEPWYLLINGHLTGKEQSPAAANRIHCEYLCAQLNCTAYSYGVEREKESPKCRLAADYIPSDYQDFIGQVIYVQVWYDMLSGITDWCIPHTDVEELMEAVARRKKEEMGVGYSSAEDAPTTLKKDQERVTEKPREQPASSPKQPTNPPEQPGSTKPDTIATGKVTPAHSTEAPSSSSSTRHTEAAQARTDTAHETHRPTTSDSTTSTRAPAHTSPHPAGSSETSVRGADTTTTTRHVGTSPEIRPSPGASSSTTAGHPEPATVPSVVRSSLPSSTTEKVSPVQQNPSATPSSTRTVTTTTSTTSLPASSRSSLAPTETTAPTTTPVSSSSSRIESTESRTTTRFSPSSSGQSQTTSTPVPTTSKIVSSESSSTLTTTPSRSTSSAASSVTTSRIGAETTVHSSPSLETTALPGTTPVPTPGSTPTTASTKSDVSTGAFTPTSTPLTTTSTTRTTGQSTSTVISTGADPSSTGHTTTTGTQTSTGSSTASGTTQGFTNIDSTAVQGNTTESNGNTTELLASSSSDSQTRVIETTVPSTTTTSTSTSTSTVTSTSTTTTKPPPAQNVTANCTTTYCSCPKDYYLFVKRDDKKFYSGIKAEVVGIMWQLYGRTEAPIAMGQNYEAAICIPLSDWFDKNRCSLPPLRNGVYKDRYILCPHGLSSVDISGGLTSQDATLLHCSDQSGFRKESGEQATITSINCKAKP